MYAFINSCWRETLTDPQLNESGAGTYKETIDDPCDIPIPKTCVVFLIIGAFEVDGNVCRDRYKAYQIVGEESLRLQKTTALVVIEPMDDRTSSAT
jgi:hypothetical protein